jgi:cytochrome c-type biogenesis protein CcmH
MRRPAPATLLTLLALTLLGALAATAAAQLPPTAVNEERVQEVAAQLRCVVCQNLSVADSPSEMANQMRAIVRERLAAGERPEQVVQYFVDRYGEWILLAPRRQGFNWLVWLFPVAAVAVGLAVVAVVLRRWTLRAARRAAAGKPDTLDPAMRERIRRELETKP